MSTRSMDVFSPRDTVVDAYKKFATSFITIHAEDIRQQVEAIYAQEHYWPEPLVQINPTTCVILETTTRRPRPPAPASPTRPASTRRPPTPVSPIHRATSNRRAS
ncbi:MAG: hypothetical protein AB7O52_06785 [Planctomycetota bacterium]